MFKAIDKWLLPWLLKSRSDHNEPVTDVMLAVCDHFEPFHHTDKAGALRRVRTWAEQLPQLTATIRGHGGVPPRHTFFYPIEQYDPEVIEALAVLCQTTNNEVEIHLHHDCDNPDNLRRCLAQGIADLRKHGMLGSNAAGQAVFAFIHGNWALDDSNPEGQGCGVRNELAILRQAGCYADLTMPAAPHPAQSRMVNQLYYARSTPHGRSHDRGTPVRVGITTALRDDPEQLLLVQGPLSPEWRRRKWGVMPRIENSDLTNNNPPSAFRMERWLKAHIHVSGRAGWRFIKLHTHGGPERNQGVLLGAAARRFHEDILALSQRQGFRLHYVSAREMVNILHAAEDGREGDASSWRDYLYTPPPRLRLA